MAVELDPMKETRVRQGENLKAGGTVGAMKRCTGNASISHWLCLLVRRRGANIHVVWLCSKCGCLSGGASMYLASPEGLAWILAPPGSELDSGRVASRLTRHCAHPA